MVGLGRAGTAPAARNHSAGLTEICFGLDDALRALVREDARPALVARDATDLGRLADHPAVVAGAGGGRLRSLGGRWAAARGEGRDQEEEDETHGRCDTARRFSLGPIRRKPADSQGGGEAGSEGDLPVSFLTSYRDSRDCLHRETPTRQPRTTPNSPLPRLPVTSALAGRIEGVSSVVVELWVVAEDAVLVEGDAAR